MSFAKKVFQFLGGSTFAIILILIASFFVILGTFIESKTQSHLQASQWTYDNPLFFLIIIGFFINILISALRRWPFQKKHIPFLLTHLGLLLLLLGVFSKKMWGLQGYMAVYEGAITNDVYIPQKEALIFKDFPNLYEKKIYAIDNKGLSHKDIHIKILHKFENSITSYSRWFFKDKLHLIGLSPIPITHQITPFFCKEYGCYLASIESENPIESISNFYLNHVKAKLFDKTSLVFNDYLTSSKSVNFSIKYSEQTKDFALHCQDLSNNTQGFLSLNEDSHLLVQSDYNDLLERFKYSIDLSIEPHIIFVKNGDKTWIFSIDSSGRIDTKEDNNDKPDSIIAYNQGFNGYARQIKLAKDLKDVSLSNLETKYLKLFENQLAHVSNGELNKPLQLFNTIAAAKKNQPLAILYQFLLNWKKSNTYLFDDWNALNDDLKDIITNFPLRELNDEEINCCLWFEYFIKLMQSKGLESLPNHILKDVKDPIEALKHLSAQLYYSRKLLPPLPLSDTPKDRLSFVSALFRLYQIHYEDIWEGFTTIKLNELFAISENERRIHLESPIIPKMVSKDSEKKLENNNPFILLELNVEKTKSTIALPFDKNGSDFYWPILDKGILVRYQPFITKIPYAIRLKDGRKISYANSNQPFSYESDVEIIHLPSGNSIETTISMNNVYETKDGFRFYMSNLSPADNENVQQVQIVVNKDPTKYLFTYPGACILCLGILLLYIKMSLKPVKI